MSKPHWNRINIKFTGITPYEQEKLEEELRCLMEKYKPMACCISNSGTGNSLFVSAP